MTNRVSVASSFFARFCRFVTRPSHSVVRRRLVPDRPSGPRATSVIYRVENCADLNFLKVASAYLKFLQQYSGTRTMISHQDQATSFISPPEAVRSMKVLDRKLFSRTVSLPGLKVPSQHIGALSKTLKVSLLKMQKVKPIADLAKDDPQYQSHKLFLLNPDKFKSGDDFSTEDSKKMAEFDIDVKDLTFVDMELGYENWNCAEILRAVLPEDVEGVSSYSIIGHIAHLNLKPEVMDYKHLIGEVILDKNSCVKTVVNKLNMIDNTFRNFKMELLAGEDNFITRAKEHGCVFEMDFSQVYWNPRLSTEHQRVTDLLKKGDVLYDVFAGVGPFAIPAAKKGVEVFANDLNPHSYSALVNNVKLNKVKAERLCAYNMDGREFIRTVVKQDLASRLKGKAADRCDGDVDGGEHQAHQVGDTDSGTGAVTEMVDVKVESEMAETGNVVDRMRCCEPHQHEAIKSSHMPQPNSASLGSRDSQKLYITMNLPAMALEFLDAFCGLLSDFPVELQSDSTVLDSLPTVLCYCFSKSEDGEADVRSRAELIMGHKLPADSKVRTVRNVAPNKEMMCVVFRLNPDVLFALDCNFKATDGSAREQTEDEPPPAKKQRVSGTLP